MTQFYSRNDVNYSGDVYSIPFDYIDKKEVKVYIDDELWTKWHFLSEHQLTLDEVPEDIRYSNIVSVRRETNIEDKVVTYDNNSLLNKENLNKSQDQLLYAVQEIYDNNTQFAIDINEYNEQFAADITNYNEQFAKDIRAEVDAKVEAVSDAVEKLEFLEDSVEIANEAALEATEQAEVAKDQAEQVKEVKQQVEEIHADLEANVKALPMFTPIWSDHILNDASYLRADTFSWHNGDIYKTAYNILLNEFNSDRSVEELEGNVTYKRTPSGFKIADIEQHENILTTFTMTGKSWFYILDIETKRFKLPRTQYSFTGIRDMVGGDVEAGLPSLTSNSTGAHTHTRGTMNITGTIEYLGAQAANATGAFYTGDNLGSGYGAGSSPRYREHFDASRNWTGATSSDGAHTHTITDSAGVVGKANTVQPPATQMYLYFFIGNYARPATDINIGELVEVVNNIDFEATLENAKNEITVVKNNCITEVNNTALGAKADRDLSNLTENGENKFNSILNNKITNCLLEVPQRIKLELNNGTLTLKAGSVVIVPNGFEADGVTPKFDYVTVESDKVCKGVDEGTNIAFLNEAGDLYASFKVNSYTGSGSSIPSDFIGMFYDTSVNKIGYRFNTSSQLAIGCSFPIAIVINASTTSTSSINQVFNGFGYIGSTVWVDKGVKGLIPNGRNEDGSLNNIEFTTNNVMTYSRGNAYSDYDLILNDGQIANSRLYLDETNNVMRKLDGGLAVRYATIGKVSADSAGKITNFQPKQPFRAVDYNDISNLTMGMPDWSAAISANAAYTSSNKFVAPSDGYLIYGYWGTASGALYVNDTVIGGLFGSGTGHGLTYPLVLPLQKGDTFYQQYANNSSFPSKNNRFIPLKGAK